MKGKTTHIRLNLPYDQLLASNSPTVKKILEAEKTIPPLFNPPGSWMDRVNPTLLFRLWQRKGMPGVLRFRDVCGFGLIVDYVPTKFGVLKIARDLVLTETL